MNHSYPTCFFTVAVLMIAAGAFIPLLLFDKTIFAILNGPHSALAGQIWLILTATGDGLVLGIVVGAFIVVNPRVVAIGIPLLLLTSLTVNLIKHIFPSLRPAEMLDTVYVVGPLLRSGSFPSGHAAAAMAAAISIVFCGSSKPMGFLIIFIAFLIGVSRICVGAHFPKDVLAGALCAFILFLILRAFFLPFVESRVPDRPSFRGKSFWAAFWLEIIAALFTIFVYGPYYSEVAAVPIVAAAAVLIFVGVRCKSSWNRILDNHQSQSVISG